MRPSLPVRDQSIALSMVARLWSLQSPGTVLAERSDDGRSSAAVRRETNSWRYPLAMAGYQFALAYLAAFTTYRAALLLGG